MEVTRKHLVWALEALANYAVYRAQGNTSSLPKIGKDSPDWPKGLIPDVDDLWDGHEDWEDLEHGDYLLVRTVLAIHAKDRPEDAHLGDFLTHVLYHRKNPGDFTVHLPFQKIPIMLGSVSKYATGNALYALNVVVKKVAIAKAEADKKKTEEEKEKKIA